MPHASTGFVNALYCGKQDTTTSRHKKLISPTSRPSFNTCWQRVFERRITALRARLKAECAEIRADRDRLAKIKEQKDSQIQALMLALGDAEVKIADQSRRISRLRKEIAERCDASGKAEQKIGYTPAGINQSGIHV